MEVCVHVWKNELERRTRDENMFACCPFHLPPGQLKYFWSVALNPLVEQGEGMDSKSNHTYFILHKHHVCYEHTFNSISPTEDIVRVRRKEKWSLRDPGWCSGVVMSAAPQEDWHYCCSPPARWPPSHGTGPLWSEVCRWYGRSDCPSPRCQWSKPVAHHPPLHPGPLLPTNPHDWISSRRKTGQPAPVASRSTDRLREAGKRF